MFDLQEFYARAHRAEPVSFEGLKVYLKSFERVVLWGVGNLGEAIASKIEAMGVPIHAYWDRRFKDIGSFRGSPVESVFSGKDKCESTLVIFCVINGSTGGQWAENLLKHNGFLNFIDGMSIYEGAICPVDKTSGMTHEVCLKAKACSICSCDRFVNLVRHYERGGGLGRSNVGTSDASRPSKQGSIQIYNAAYESPEKIPAVDLYDKWGGGEDALIFNTLTFAVNQKCSLQCIDCGQFMNDYKGSNRANFSVKQIKSDVDKIFDAVDTIGMVSIIGGECFLHPNLNEIIHYILEKPNFGIINITTNGVFKLKSGQLQGLANPRIKVSFSHYKGAISEAQERNFQDNYAAMRQAGIICSSGVPVWNSPGTLMDKRRSDAEKAVIKSECNAIKLCMSVKNGFFYPCSKTEPLHALNVVDYPTDYIDLNSMQTRTQLQDAIREIRSREFYQSCGTCGDGGAETLPLAGVQLNEHKHRLASRA